MVMPLPRTHWFYHIMLPYRHLWLAPSRHMSLPCVYCAEPVECIGCCSSPLILLAQAQGHSTSRSLQSTSSSYYLPIVATADDNILIYVAPNVVSLPGNAPSGFAIVYIPPTNISEPGVCTLTWSDMQSGFLTDVNI